MFHQFEFLFILPISFFLLFFFFYQSWNFHIRLSRFLLLLYSHYRNSAYSYLVLFQERIFLQSHSCQSFIVYYLQTCSSLVKKIRIDKPQSYRPKRFYLRVTPPFILSLPSGIMSDFKSIKPPKELDLFIKHIFQPNCCYFVLNTFSMVSNSHPLSWNVVFGS